MVLTRGGQGVVARHRTAGKIEVAAPPVRLVDTIGAGDSLQGALLAALRELGRIEARALAALEADELRRALTFAVTCAATTCGRVGADPPRRAKYDFRARGEGRIVRAARPRVAKRTS